MNKLTASEIKPIITHVITNNLRLAEKNVTPKAICIEGSNGIGKTQLVKQICEELGTHCFIRLNPSNLTVDDLIGYPCIQFELLNPETNKIVWATKEILESYINLGLQPTSKTRMSYSTPQWLANKENKPVLMFLDDHSRSSPLVQQALMTIVDEQSFMTWNLPKGSTIILSSNPDNCSFMVTSEDEAQKDRKITLQMKASVEDWAAWATGIIPDKFIDFLQKHKEVIEKVDEDSDTPIGSLRGWTRYFQTIETINDLDSDWYKLALPLSGGLPQEHIMLFHSFIKEKLDKLPTTFEILNSLNIKSTIETLKVLTKDRKDIASLITKRLYNHVIKFTSTLKKVEIENYIKLLEDDSLLSKDLVFIYLRNLAQPAFENIFNVTKNPVLINKIIN